MAEVRHSKVEQDQKKVRKVPIAVTPEGFWCCPSPVMFQKNLKTQNPLNKPKSSPPASKNSTQNKRTPETEKKPAPTVARSELGSDDQRKLGIETPVSTSLISESNPPPKIQNLPRKVLIEFGEPGTSDLVVVLLGKQRLIVKLSVHKSVLLENSGFFADKFSEQQPGLTCLEIDDFEDVEICVETVGLMYCKEINQQLIKQSVSRVLRILKVAEQLRFNFCIQSCLEYLEAVPWVGEEEEKVVASVTRLHGEGIGITPVLNRVSSGSSNPPEDTISHILELVLKSKEEKGRREMKTIVLKLLKENNNNLPTHSSSVDICNEAIFSSCRSCLGSLLSIFVLAAESGFTDKPMDIKETVVKQLALEADNLTWLLEILADRQAADKFAVMWSSQQELASLHTRLPIVYRYHVSCISGRLFVGIGRGELLPSKDTRQLLLKTWLQPLMYDYSWLRRSLDQKAVEEGIGRTILTLPLEEQQSILLSWLASFLKSGDNFPNLQRAFEVWWRRSFIRPHVEHASLVHPDSSMT